ncbi:MAG: tRNA pseudouridine(38-40) synthase TruA [Actinomycetota bacterium]|nr:tRNA pseudouridine(38-40) synthase TruA [Actinomycetota bacterium]
MNVCSEPPPQGGSGACSAPVGPSGRIRLALEVAYDGAAFRGFAENTGVTTVAGELRAALERTLRQPLELTCAGRTDAGVHGRGQVVTFDVDPTGLRGDLDDARLRNAINSQLAPQVVVREVNRVGPDFDARFSATWRLYRYSVLNSPVPDPFLARTAWWVTDPLDRDALASATFALVGQHDFSSFCRRPRGADEVSLVRRVLHARWTDRDDGMLCLEIAGSSFCHQMVRSIVGTVVDVGRGRRSAEDVPAILAARDRNAASNVAPPQGLCLWQVGYDAWPVGADLLGGPPDGDDIC